MNIISGQWLNAEQTRADLQVEHPGLGVIPYTYDAADPGGSIKADDVIGAPIAAYVPPTQEELDAEAARVQAAAAALFVRSEQSYVRERLEEIEDGDPRGRGTAQVWRNYRKALRDYADNPDLPKPVRPA